MHGFTLSIKTRDESYLLSKIKANLIYLYDKLTSNAENFDAEIYKKMLENYFDISENTINDLCESNINFYRSLQKGELNTKYYKTLKNSLLAIDVSRNYDYACIDIDNMSSSFQSICKSFENAQYKPLLISESLSKKGVFLIFEINKIHYENNLIMESEYRKTYDSLVNYVSFITGEIVDYLPNSEQRRVLPMNNPKFQFNQVYFKYDKKSLVLPNKTFVENKNGHEKGKFTKNRLTHIDGAKFPVYVSVYKGEPGFAFVNQDRSGDVVDVDYSNINASF